MNNISDLQHLPDYVDDLGHGSQCFLAPISVKDVMVYGFPFRVNRKRLQAFIDDQLNVSGGEVFYTALPFVIQAWTHVSRATTEAQEVGWMSDREVMFFVPLLQRHHQTGIPTLKFWMPYLFIDVMSGMTTARETFGYRKMPATIQVPKASTEFLQFTAETVIFRQFDREREGEKAEFLRTSSDQVVGTLQQDWHAPERALKTLFSLIGQSLGVTAPIVEDAVLTTAFSSLQFPMVGLKQFRDARDGTKACYQALIESPGALDHWGGGGLLPANFETTFETNDSYQILNDLGLPSPAQPSTTVKALFGFWMNISFTVINGSVIWQAPGTK